MATHLLVDGYNLLGSAGMGGPTGGGRLEAAREALLRDLAGYRQRKRHAITVVFDGWQGGLGAEQREFQSGVEVVYSKRGERADQVIQRLARLYGGNCAVVSSDHEVVNAARAAGAFVMGASEFRAKLQERPSGQPEWRRRRQRRQAAAPRTTQPTPRQAQAMRMCGGWSVPSCHSPLMRMARCCGVLSLCAVGNGNYGMTGFLGRAGDQPCNAPRIAELASAYRGLVELAKLGNQNLRKARSDGFRMTEVESEILTLEEVAAYLKA